ncbi:MAG: hypothetical protein A2Y76_01680 [Planctomycetes bacterium RBG_13_60_9]|nr:MAG: hypothetical protein A2Y76_01680 [Planctomycetes bacterium RBG_13_60_9]
MCEGLTLTSAGTVSGQVDTVGFDYAMITIQAGTAEAAETAVTTLALYENDTALTAATSGTVIYACQGAAATSTSAGFVLPPLSSTKQTTLQLLLDLRGRKRYIAAQFAPTKQTVGVSLTAHLFRPENSTDNIATVATTSDGLRLFHCA